MAMIELINGKKHFIPAEQGIAIWEILNGEREPANQEQENYCLKVKRIYLNRYNAPASYLAKHAHLLVSDGPMRIPKKQELQSRLPYKD